MVIAKPLPTTPSPSTSPRRSPRSGGDLYVYTIYQYRPLNDIIIKKRRLRRSPFTCVIWQIPPLPTVGDNLALRGCSSLPRHASGLCRQNRQSATLVKNRICHALRRFIVIVWRDRKGSSEVALSFLPSFAYVLKMDRSTSYARRRWNQLVAISTLKLPLKWDRTSTMLSLVLLKYRSGA